MKKSFSYTLLTALAFGLPLQADEPPSAAPQRSAGKAKPAVGKTFGAVKVAGGWLITDQHGTRRVADDEFDPFAEIPGVRRQGDELVVDAGGIQVNLGRQPGSRAKSDQAVAPGVSGVGGSDASDVAANILSGLRNGQLNINGIGIDLGSEVQAAVRGGTGQAAVAVARGDAGMQPNAAFLDAVKRMLLIGQPQVARRMISESKAGFSDSSDLSQLESLACLRAADYPQAARAAHRALAMGPSWTWPQLRSCYSSTAAYTADYRELQRVEAANPDQPELTFLLAYHEWMLGHQDEATRLFQRVLAMRPDEPVSRQVLQSMSQPRDQDAPPSVRDQ